MHAIMNSILVHYRRLLKIYGPQGWWPLLDLHDGKIGKNPTKTGSIKGYHPNDYSFPKNNAQRFEICIGAICTQNTNWSNVEKALLNLRAARLLDAKHLAISNDAILKICIRPAGYYNQKAKKLKIFARYYSILKRSTPTRDQLLALWGIGPETADSILLYAFKVPTFVVDAYTKRFLLQEGLIEGHETYDTIKRLFERNLPQSVKIYQEFHALIVEHMKH